MPPPEPHSTPSGRAAPSSVLSPMLGAITGGGLAMLPMIQHLRQQLGALAGGPVTQGSRMHAMMATAVHGPGTVGAGAHANIRAIHLLLGEIGAAGIGHLFAHPHSQQFQNAVMRFAGANMNLASAEHSFWGARLFGNPFTFHGTTFPAMHGFGPRFGGLLGSAAFPGPRAMLQMFGASFPRVPMAMAATLGIGASATLGHQLFERFNSNSEQHH